MMPTRIQSALDAAGIQASRIELLWWIMFWVSTAVFIAVMVAIVVALWRGSSKREPRPSERTLARAVIAATVVTVVTLIGLLVASVATGRAVASLTSSDPLTIRVTGYQWWWKVEYLQSMPSQQVVTANELHLPVGQPTALRLQS